MLWAAAACSTDQSTPTYKLVAAISSCILYYANRAASGMHIHACATTTTTTYSILIFFFSFADEEEQTDFFVAAQLIALVKYVYFVCLFV